MIKYNANNETLDITDTLSITMEDPDPGTCPPGTAWCPIANVCNPIPAGGGGSCGGTPGGGGGTLPPPSGGGSDVGHVPPASTTPPNPACQPLCLALPCQPKYNVAVCKIKWSAGSLSGCKYSWTTVSNFKSSPLARTTAGDTKYVLKDGPSWNPPLVGPPNPGWKPPFAKNLPEVIADKISCNCEVIPDYDPVYAKANLYPGVGVGYQRSKVIIVYTDELYKNQPALEECPKRDIEYHLHVNRLTERIRINRRTR